MCRKFLVSIISLLVATLLLAGMTDASLSCDRRKESKSLCRLNQQKATQFAAEAALSAAAAMEAPVNATDPASHQMKLDLADQAQQAAQMATDILGGKQHQLDIIVKRLADSEKTIEEGNRAIAVTICAIKRVLWIRDNTRQGLDNLMGMYNASKGNQADISHLAAFARQEEVEKAQLLEAAMGRLSDLKNSLQKVQAELKTIRQSAREANHAAEEARQRIDMLRRLVPKIKMLKPKDLQDVTEFLIKHRRASKHKKRV